MPEKLWTEVRDTVQEAVIKKKKRKKAKQFSEKALQTAMKQCEKVKAKVSQSCPTLCNPVHYRVHGILQARILEWVAFSFSRGSSQARIEPRSPTLQVDYLPAEPQGKPKNIGEGSLSEAAWMMEMRPWKRAQLALLLNIY